MDREIPWMRMGKLDTPAQSATQAIKMAGLDQTVSKVEIAWRSGDNTWQPTDRRVALVNDTTGEFYECVSPNYQVFQWHEAFSFLDAVSPRFVAAGPLKNGRQAFLAAELPNSSYSVGGDDKHRTYALLRSSHDKSRAIEINLVTIRYRCTNQLTISNLLSKGRARTPQRWSIPHLKSSHDKLLQAQATLARHATYVEQFCQTAERLMLSHPPEKTVREILTRHVVPSAKQQDQVLDRILYQWHENTQTVGFNDTAWGVVQAASEWYDWERPQGTPESRFRNSLQGSTHIAIDKITRDLLALAA